MTTNLQPLTDKELDELERKAQAALKQAWERWEVEWGYDDEFSVPIWQINNPDYFFQLGFHLEETAFHIAANHPTTTLRLVSEIRRLRQVLRDMQRTEDVFNSMPLSLQEVQAPVVVGVLGGMASSALGEEIVVIEGLDIDQTTD